MTRREGHPGHQSLGFSLWPCRLITMWIESQLKRIWRETYEIKQKRGHRSKCRFCLESTITFVLSVIKYIIDDNGRKHTEFVNVIELWPESPFWLICCLSVQTEQLWYTVSNRAHLEVEVCVAMMEQVVRGLAQTADGADQLWSVHGYRVLNIHPFHLELHSR